MISSEAFIAISSVSIGAIVGSLSTLVVQEYREKRKRDRRRDNIRGSLYAEINQGVEILEDYKNPGAATGQFLPTTTYETVSDEIGLLESGESKKVIRYYAQANHLNGIGSKIESIPRDEFTGVTEPVEVSKWQKARRDTLKWGEEVVDTLSLEKDGSNTGD